MAKFYMGNLESADKGMWEALRALPDEYHVFVEFQIPDPQRQRQVDFLVIRDTPDTGCLFLLEVKNERRRLRGTINGPWQYEEAAAAWMPLFTSNRQDQNPLQQAYNTAMVMKNWLLSMQALIQDPDDPWIDPYQTLTIFPRLVLPFAHRDNQLQIDRFTWRFDSYDEALDSLMKFMPREAFHMGRPEIERLAQHLGVKYLPDEPRPQVETGVGLSGLRGEFRELISQVAALRQEMQALRTAMTRTPAPAPAPRFTTPHTGGNRSLDEVFEALAEVLRELRDGSRRRVFPNVHEGLIRRLGSFSPAAFGFQRFKDFMTEAERRGHIRVHSTGLVDYAFLPGENPAAAVASALGENTTAGAPNLITLNRGDQIAVKVLNLPLHTKWMDPWAELVGVSRGDTRISLTQPGLNIQVVSTKEQRTLPLTSKMVHLIPSFDVPPEFREERFVLDETQQWKHLKGSAVERFFLPDFVGTELEAEIVSITPTGNIVANCRALDQALMRAYDESKDADRSAVGAMTLPSLMNGNGNGNGVTVPTIASFAVGSEADPDTEMLVPASSNGHHPGLTLETTIGELAEFNPQLLEILSQREGFSDLSDEMFVSRLRMRTLAQVVRLFDNDPREVLDALTREAVSVE